MPSYMSLLDDIRIQYSCDFISDLHFLTNPQRAELAKILQKIPATQISLSVWNDALCYLTDAPAQKTSIGAKERLIFELIGNSTLSAE